MKQSQFSKDMETLVDDLQKVMRVATGLGHITYNLDEKDEIDFDTAMRLRYLTNKLIKAGDFASQAVDEIYSQQSKEAWEKYDKINREEKDAIYDKIDKEG